jgi:hypothetical protein
MKRISLLIAVCMALAWSAAAATKTNEGEPRRSYGAIDVIMYQTSW